MRERFTLNLENGFDSFKHTYSSLCKELKVRYKCMNLSKPEMDQSFLLIPLAVFTDPFVVVDLLWQYFDHYNFFFPCFLL